VCGPRPYAGDLLIGGSARLTAIGLILLQPTSLARPVRVQRLPDLVFNYGGAIDLGSVQLIQISLPDVPACPPPTAVQSAGIHFGGTAEEVPELRLGRSSRAGEDGWADGTDRTQARRGR